MYNIGQYNLLDRFLHFIKITKCDYYGRLSFRAHYHVLDKMARKSYKEFIICKQCYESRKKGA
jgi:hypothetical protein